MSTAEHSPTPPRQAPRPQAQAPQAPARAGQPGGPVGEAEIAAFAHEAAAALAALGQRDAAAAVRAEAAAPGGGEAVVVVVGEKKRGKSSLINALVEWPGLLPVDADVATSTHLSVRYGPQVAVTVVDADSPGGRGVPVGDIAAYASLDPDTGRPRRPGVAHVGVALPHPLLQRGLCLMDTPGVGGLIAGHTAITLGAVAEADALVFVVDGSSELTASECAFLQQASARVATVLFALTHIDVYPDWQAVAERNRALVAEHAPRYADAPWFPVSSRMKADAVAAARAGRAEIAARRRERSRYGALETALVQVAARRSGVLRLANTVHLAATALDDASVGLRMRLGALATDPEVARRVAEEHERLTGLQKTTAAWRRGLDAKFAALETKLKRDVDGALSRFVADAGNRAAAGGKETLEVLPQEVESAMAGLWADVQWQLHAGVRAITEDLQQRLGVGSGLADRVVFAARLHRLPPLVRSSKESGVDVAAAAAPSSAALNFAAASMHVLSAAALPLAGVGAGLQVVAQMRRATTQERSRRHQDAQRYIQAVAKFVAADVPAAIQDTLKSVHASITREVADRIRGRITEAEAALAEHQRLLAAATEDITARRDAVQQELRRVDALRGRAAHLQTRLGVRPTRPTAAPTPAAPPPATR